ncbi:MAG: hypothetical protein J0H62_06635 [Rhizobiales bacterium]|nr:hypothetical protein [Hyphomicrobiales bacterium]
MRARAAVNASLRSTFAGHGYALRGMRAFDLFPNTQHVEAVATLTR